MKTKETTVLENTSMNVEDTYSTSSSNLINRREIKKTPFEMITIGEGEEEKAFISWGKFRLTEETTRAETLTRVIQLEEGKTDWDIIGAMTTAIIMNINENN